MQGRGPINGYPINLIRVVVIVLASRLFEGLTLWEFRERFCRKLTKTEGLQWTSLRNRIALFLFLGLTWRVRQ